MVFRTGNLPAGFGGDLKPSEMGKGGFFAPGQQRHRFGSQLAGGSFFFFVTDVRDFTVCLTLLSMPNFLAVKGTFSTHQIFS